VKIFNDQKTNMKHLSLFNGIGGFQLAAHWMGWENVASVEIDEFCNKVTKKHFPNCIQHGDIKTTDFVQYRDKINIITGGFPCQPFSQVGKRKGEKDERFLWDFMFAAVDAIRPKVFLAENVYGLINISEGMVIERICSDLEDINYAVIPFIIPSASVGTNHKRERVWIIAHPVSYGMERCGVAKNTFKYRQGGADSQAHLFNQREFTTGYSAESESELIRADDGLPDWMDRVKALGNAIVPQIAYEIFKAIESTLTPNPAT